MKPWDEIAQDPASGFIFSNVYGYAFSKLNPKRPSGRPANHMLTIITLTPSSYWLHSDPSPLFWQRAHHDRSFILSIVLNLKKASNKCTPNCQPTPSGLGHIYGFIIIQSHLRLSQFHLLFQFAQRWPSTVDRTLKSITNHNLLSFADRKWTLTDLSIFKATAWSTMAGSERSRLFSCCLECG